MNRDKEIEVVADWCGLPKPAPMGRLLVRQSRGREIFSFEYDPTWLSSAPRRSLDPALRLFGGPQYPEADRESFGLFLDSSPDRWGRMLMRRREALAARKEGRPEHQLRESDYLLGVHDRHRMGALRFRIAGGNFLDDRIEMATPPWASLRELEHASRHLEQRDAHPIAEESRWLRMLIAPGGSLGGARPKAGVIDESGRLWIAKFPSTRDDVDIGAWEAVVHDLAESSGITVPEAQLHRFSSSGHTFLSRRFDRSDEGCRIHMASAMTLLGRRDGDDGHVGASYLELAEILIQNGSNTSSDLEQLWRRIVFNICISNTDDHLRNHAFLLGPMGWALAPAYDLNPNPDGNGLTLNITETDNSQELALAFEVSDYFRLDDRRADEIVRQVTDAVKSWRTVAAAHGLGEAAQDRVKRAFRVVDE